ncbi:hypothetical protein BZG02_16645 [Labilibaculum filiforme]|uniref:Uncharacterized protein n=1 Tax=Labilibaculum filiforme TaxID=1940526 RepID=A0A2N3HT95_9BACT|nr:hypothetical protein [Labilibaculum filiforme]PKQ61261.1 hypothetical protein BZG02_16645 [Labilibaculum filiforme]
MLILLVIFLSYALVRITAHFSKYLIKFTGNDHLRFAYGIGFIVIGAMHILIPTLFEHMFSTISNSTYELITILGFILIICGIGLLIRRVHKEAAIVLIVLMLIFIPLSIIFLTRYVPGPLGMEYEPLLGYLRILAYFLLIWFLIKACELSPRRKYNKTKYDQNI